MRHVPRSTAVLTPRADTHSAAGPLLAARWKLLEELFGGLCTVYPVLRARAMQVLTLAFLIQGFAFGASCFET